MNKLLFTKDEFYVGQTDDLECHQGYPDCLLALGVVGNTIEFSDELWEEQVEYFQSKIKETIEGTEYEYVVLDDVVFYKNEEILPIQMEGIVDVYYNTDDNVVCVVHHNKEKEYFKSNIVLLTEQDVEHFQSAKRLFNNSYDGVELKFDGRKYYI